MLMKNLMLMFCVLVVSSYTYAVESTSLDAFLKQIEERNLDLKIKNFEVEASDANSIGIGVPPPMFGIVQMQTLGTGTALGYEVNQTLQFPGKLLSNKSARNNEALMYKELYQVQKNEVLSTAKITYIMYWLASEKVKTLKERKKVIEEHAKLARTGARSDSSLKLHLLRTESDLDLTENDLEEMKQKLNENRLMIAAQLNQSATEPLFDPIEPKLSQLPDVLVKESHQVKAAYYQWQSAESKTTEAKQAWLPDFNVRFREVGQTVMSPASSELMVSVSLPFIFPWDPYSMVSKAKADSHVAEFKMQKSKRDIESAQESLFSRAHVIKKQLKNLNDNVIPKAHQRMKVVQNIAPRDMGSLQDHRETMEAYLELKMKALDLREEYERVVAEFEKFNYQDRGHHE